MGAQAGHARAAGPVERAVALLAVLAGAMVLATAALSVPLSALGWWRPVVVVPLLIAVALGIGVHLLSLPLLPIGRGPMLAVLAVALGSGWWSSATHSTQVLPRRDAGSNLQAAIALAQTGRRILELPVASLGGAGVLDLPGITLASPAFYQVGSAADPAIEPQFVIGPAATYSVGHWFGGVGTMLVQPAWIGALALLALGVLAALLIGPWWGPVAALAVAIQFPILHTARAGYSEPLALLTLAAGLLAWVLAVRLDHPRWALLAGVLIGGTCLVRIDGLREAFLVLPFAALALLQRARWVRPMLLGTGLATALSFLAALALSRRYLGDIAASLLPLLAMGAVLAVAVVLAARARARGRRLPAAIRARLPDALAGSVLVAGAALALRPLVMTVRQDPNDPGARVVAGLQARQGLPVDGGRTYAEHTVTWLAWWVGPVALVAALVTLALLARAAALSWARGDVLPAWAGPAGVAAGSTLLTLYRPGITPDHPWAERRLVIALPFVALLVVAAAAWLWRRRGAAGPGGGLPAPVAGLAALATAAALLIPTALATWPHRSERVERGSLFAVISVCNALRPGDVVLAVDGRAANEWPQVIRGQCGHPALSTTSALRSDPAQLTRTASQIRDALPAGSRLVLLAADTPDPGAGPAALSGGQRLTALGLSPHVAADVEVAEDARLLERRPDALVPLSITVWLAPLT